MWKCARNVLPTKDNLLRRNIPSRSSCMRCGEPETLIHLMFTACLLLIFGALSRGPRLLTPPSAPRFNWNWRHLELKSASPSGNHKLLVSLDMHAGTYGSAGTNWSSTSAPLLIGDPQESYLCMQGMGKCPIATVEASDSQTAQSTSFPFRPQHRDMLHWCSSESGWAGLDLHRSHLQRDHLMLSVPRCCGFSSNGGSPSYLVCSSPCVVSQLQIHLASLRFPRAGHSHQLDSSIDWTLRILSDVALLISSSFLSVSVSFVYRNLDGPADALAKVCLCIN